MGFDLSTAKPVSQPDSGRFDITTASEVGVATPSALELPEIGMAHELNEMSVPAFKASLGLLTTGDDKSLRGILSAQFGDRVSYAEDADGNTIVTLPSGSYALNKPGVSPQDVAQFTFDALSFTPAGRAATIPRALAASAATEAGIEAAETALGGDFSPADIAIAGGIGGAAKGVENTLGAGFRMLKGNSANATVDAAADSGIPVFTSDARPPKTFVGRHASETAEKIPLVGTGGLRQKQQIMREGAVDEFIGRYADPSYETIIRSLKNKKQRIKRAAGSVMESTGRKLDDAGEISVDQTRAAIAKARENLSKPGVMGGGDELSLLDDLEATLSEAPQTFTTLKENRTAFSELVDSVDASDKSQMVSRGKSLLIGVRNAMKSDMDDFAKKGLTSDEYSKWTRANATYAEEAIRLKKSRMKNVLDKGDVTPESVQTVLFSSKPSEVQSLYRSLTPQGRKHARAAIVQKVVNDLSKRQSGLTPNSFATEMGKYGVQLDHMFKGEERQAVRGLIKALSATRRAQDASVTTNTGQALVGGVSGISMYLDPTATLGTAGTLGGLAQLYESAPVRNALLRLDSVPEGSSLFLRALDDVQVAMNSTAQALKAEAREKLEAKRSSRK